MDASSSKELLVVEDVDGVRTITINRPEVKNALTAAMRARFCELVAEADADDATRAVIVTAVDPVFSAGVDFKEWEVPDLLRRGGVLLLLLRDRRARGEQSREQCKRGDAHGHDCTGAYLADHGISATPACRFASRACTKSQSLRRLR